jgi:hypothetical protein
MIDDPWFYAAALPAVLVLGLAKGGFGSVGLLVVPILSLVVSPVQAAGIVLPILVLSDLVALASYWGQWDGRVMAIMLPGALVGVAIGWWTAAWVGEEQIRLILGLISVAFALNYWIRQRADSRRASRTSEGRSGRRQRLHQLRQPCRRPAPPDLRHAAPPRAAPRRDDGVVLLHRQRAEAGALFLPRPVLEREPLTRRCFSRLIPATSSASG